ncbi:MAG: hypothetical protein HUJ68_07490 [Clostridia bacterium]|nr:hypothetical protein [Clostridia bacterium]
MKLVNINKDKTDLIEDVFYAKFKKEYKMTDGLIGIRQTVWFNLDNQVTPQSMNSIAKPLSASKIEGIATIQDNKLVFVSPIEFKKIYDKIKKAEI